MHDGRENLAGSAKGVKCHTLDMLRSFRLLCKSPVILRDVAVVELRDFVFTRMPCESYRRRFGSLLLSWCDVFPALINSLCLWILHKLSMPRLSAALRPQKP